MNTNTPTPSTWTLDDALYGLRNLAIGDDEETRIGDALDNVQPPEVQSHARALVAASRFADAYAVAIWPVLRDLTPGEVIDAIDRWVREFADDDSSDDLRADMLDTYHDVALGPRGFDLLPPDDVSVVRFVVVKADGSTWADFEMTGTAVAIAIRFDDWRQQPGTASIIVQAGDRVVMEFHASGVTR